MRPNNLKIGDRLKILRHKMNITLGKAGEKLGLSLTHLSDYENNRRNPSAKKIADFAKFYGVSTDYLIGGVEDNKNSGIHDPKDEADFAHFISKIKQLSQDKFKLAVKQINEYRTLFEKLERHDVPKIVLSQTYKSPKKTNFKKK